MYHDRLCPKCCDRNRRGNIGLGERVRVVPTPPALTANSAVNPHLPTPLPYTVILLGCSTEPFVNQPVVLDALYSASPAHPGLSFWMLVAADFPLTAPELLQPPFFRAINEQPFDNYLMPAVPFNLPAIIKKRARRS